MVQLSKLNNSWWVQKTTRTCVCICACLTRQNIPSAVGVSLASVPPVTIALLWLPPASRSVSYPWRVGAGLKPPKKNLAQNFSNTENGDVCRCVCLWWFRNKFPISGCMFSSVFVNASPCLCTRVCVSAYMHSGVRREQSSAAFCCSVILVWLAFRLLFESAGSAEPSHPGNNQHPGKDRGSDLKEKDEAQWEWRKRKKERQRVKMRKWKRVSSSQKLKV